jgi:hypothetical protein
MEGAGMAVFGKRGLNEGQHVIPPRVWAEPEAAWFFERIGAKPNDADNIRVTPEAVERMIAEGRADVAATIEKLPQQMRAKGHESATFKSFWVLQDNCWNGELGDFLVYELELNPYEDWSTIFLPGDARAAQLVGRPAHPGANVPFLAALGGDVLLKPRAKLMAALEDARRTEEFGRFADFRDDMIRQVKALAGMFRTYIAEAHKASTGRPWFEDFDRFVLEHPEIGRPGAKA